MLQPRVEDQPEVDPEVGAPVEASYGHEAELVRRGPYSSKAGDPARRTDVDPARAGRIGHKISRPPHHEMSKELEPRKAFFADGVEERHITGLLDLRLRVRVMSFSIHQ